MSRFTLKGRRGFTLIEIMIVVLIIAVLLAIAIPNFMKARDTSRTKACVANLRQIDTGKVQYAMDAKLAAGAPVTEAQGKSAAKISGTGASQCPVTVLVICQTVG